MIWYLLNILILTLLQFVFVVNSAINHQQGRKVLCFTASLSWIILSGFRHISIGADTISYQKHFSSIEYATWSSLFKDIQDKFIYDKDIKDPGYSIVVKLCQVFTDNYQVFLIIVAIFFTVLMGITIYKYSKDPYQSFLLYASLFYAFFSLTGIRQTIATAIVVFGGIKFIKERKLIPFLALFVIAVPIHMSSICFLPFYFIAKIKINKGTLFVYWIAIGLSFAFREQFMSFLGELVGYEEYGISEGATITNFMLILLFAATVLTIFYKLVVDNNNLIIRMSANALFVACIFSSFLMLNQNTMRVVQYYSLFLLILMPEFKNIFKDSRSVAIFNIAYTVLLCFLLFKDPLEYKFFWM